MYPNDGSSFLDSVGKFLQIKAYAQDLAAKQEQRQREREIYQMQVADHQRANQQEDFHTQLMLHAQGAMPIDNTYAQKENALESGLTQALGPPTPESYKPLINVPTFSSSSGLLSGGGASLGQGGAMGTPQQQGGQFYRLPSFNQKAEVQANLMNVEAQAKANQAGLEEDAKQRVRNKNAVPVSFPDSSGNNVTVSLQPRDYIMYQKDKNDADKNKFANGHYQLDENTGTMHFFATDTKTGQPIHKTYDSAMTPKTGAEKLSSAQMKAIDDEARDEAKGVYEQKYPTKQTLPSYDYASTDLIKRQMETEGKKYYDKPDDSPEYQAILSNIRARKINEALGTGKQSTAASATNATPRSVAASSLPDLLNKANAKQAAKGQPPIDMNELRKRLTPFATIDEKH